MTQRSESRGRFVRGLSFAALTAIGFISGVIALADAASAQFFPFFDDRYPFIERRRAPPPREYQPRERPVDYTRAPAPARKPDTAAAKTVVVLGDSMADWLAYGLEDAFSETPEVAIVRKHRTVSGLVRNESRSDSFDWVQSARDILAQEKADFIVVMLGLNDRQSIRERIVRPAPPAGQPGGSAQHGAAGQAGAQQQGAAPPANAQKPAASPTAPAGASAQKPATPPGAPAQAAAPAQPSANTEASPEEGQSGGTPVIAAPEPHSAAAGSVTHEFRSERWAELYAKRVEDMLAVLKAKNVPVYWVGLPAIRGARSTADAVYLNDLFRSRAERAGAMYIDAWDAFVDENNNYMVQGPDLEGQTRRLRAADGVHFTKAGARKLAHYVEREIQRALVAKPVLVSLPTAEEAPAPAKPGTPAGRPAAGPIVYLTGNSAGAQELLGGGPARTPAADPVAQKVLVKGETVSAPPGRADDFAWPRREISMASVSNVAEPAAPAPPGSAAARAAANPGGQVQPPVIKPAPAKRVVQKPIPPQPPPGIYQPPPQRSFWPFGLFR